MARAKPSQPQPCANPKPPVASDSAEVIKAAPTPGGKLGVLISLLRRPEGATVATLQDATGWQAHSVRGAMSGALKKKGLTVVSEKKDGVRTYRIADGAGA